MTLTLKKGIDVNSLTLQHSILLHAMMLLEGREGSLETEKRIYLMMAMIDKIIDEDLIQLCNDDGRNLIDLLEEEIEPFFNTITANNKDIKQAYDYMVKVLLQKCQEVWDRQHSLAGVIDSMITILGTMDEVNKKEALVETAKIAEKAFERRTEKMEKQASAANDKLEALVQQYQRASLEKKADSVE